jgi:protein-L-isoaspartate(D-aspartate) O-methyltransferase
MQEPVSNIMKKFVFRFLSFLFTVILSTPVLNCGDKLKTEESYEKRREIMVTEQIASRGIRDGRVLQAMQRVPRHQFVPMEQRNFAYEDHALPIGHGQTISQPYIVALMTELARVKPEDTVLEVGTGSGYQAALLSLLANRVYSIEYIEALGLEAKKRLEKLNYDNVEIRIGDGYHGWPERQPFDAILVTASIDHVPKALVNQLKPGGRLVIPLGGESEVQTLLVAEKDIQGIISQREVAPVRFVPFLGRRGRNP